MDIRIVWLVRCCYTVQEERAIFFRENFGENCVSLLTENEKNSLSTKDWKNEGKNLFSLSLLNANLFILEKNGIKPENVLICENLWCKISWKTVKVKIFRRKIYNQLLDWKQNRSDSALLVEGARRIGKSFIVETFAKNE